jgi:hypothetical protein
LGRLISATIAAERADFCLLNLTMHLVCSKPVNGEFTSETRSLYLLLKSIISTLEAVGINSIEMLQGRLLMTVFEVGHGLYPGAYISSGANVRAAVDLGVNATSFARLLNLHGSRERAEEAQRLWVGIIAVDRSGPQFSYCISSISELTPMVIDTPHSREAKGQAIAWNQSQMKMELLVLVPLYSYSTKVLNRWSISHQNSPNAQRYITTSTEKTYANNLTQCSS